MVIGIDMGASAVKIAALEGDRIVLTHYEPGREADVPALLSRLGINPASAERVAITGLSAATVTHHMQILLNARLVGFELRGARSIYSLNREGAEQLSLDLRGFLGV